MLQCNSDVTECNDNKEKEEEKQRTENREQQEEQFHTMKLLPTSMTNVGTRYKATKSTKELIHARIEEGFTKDDCFTVIDNKVATWKGTGMGKVFATRHAFPDKQVPRVSQ